MPYVFFSNSPFISPSSSTLPSKEPVPHFNELPLLSAELCENLLIPAQIQILKVIDGKSAEQEEALT